MVNSKSWVDERLHEKRRNTMKRNFLLISLIAFALVFVVGCAQETPTTKKQGKQQRLTGDRRQAEKPRQLADRIKKPLGQAKPNNYALKFDGDKSNDYDIGTYIEIKNRPHLNFTNTLTISAWVRPARLTERQSIVNKSYALDSYKLELVDYKWRFVLSFPGGKWGRSKEVAYPAKLQKWVYVTGVYDGKFMLLYINGKEVAKKKSHRILQQSIRPLAIGNHPSWMAFKGSIDEVSLWRRALSGSEISLNMSKKLTGNEPGLVAYFNFDNQNSKNIVRDLSKFKNHGEIFGSAKFYPIDILKEVK